MISRKSTLYCRGRVRPFTSITLRLTYFFFFQAEDGIRDYKVTGVQTCALPICRDAAWLGVELAAAANGGGGPRISTPGSRVSAWLVPTNEEVMIARHTQRVQIGRASCRERV